LIDFQKSLELNSKNKNSLNNRGYIQNLLGEYKKAIIDFNVAIDLDSNFAYSYNNRGLAKIKLGFVEEGLKDIHTSLEIDNSNSYGYRNLGIYYYDKDEFAKALEQFEIAHGHDANTHLLNEYISNTKIKMAST